MIRKFLTTLLGVLLCIGAKAQYKVTSITGQVMIETVGGQKRSLQLRESLTAQTKLSISYNSQVELLFYFFVGVELISCHSSAPDKHP